MLGEIAHLREALGGWIWTPWPGYAFLGENSTDRDGFGLYTVMLMPSETVVFRFTQLALRVLGADARRLL